MHGALSTLRHRFFPPIPAEIAGDFAHLQYARLRSQIPLLYVTLILSTIAATFGIDAQTHILIRVVLPIAVIGAFCVRLIIWLRRQHVEVELAKSVRVISSAGIISLCIAGACSLWTVMTWIDSEPGTRIYLPFFMAMGSLSTAYCMSTIRGVTILHLVIGLVPISILQMIYGDQMDRSFGASLIVATTFLIRMIFQQHVQLVAMLLLQRQMQALANTDALTGLLNRRALYNQVTEQLTHGSVTLMLLDLDGFKPVNDRHGHAAGDALLRQVSERMLAACPASCRVARLGGDEFAILVPGDSQQDATALADHLLSTLVTPFILPQGQVRISASLGLAISPQHGRDVDELMLSADRMLYAAKDLHYQQLSSERTLRVNPLVATR